MSAVWKDFNCPEKSFNFFHTCKSENKSLLENNIIIVIVSCIFKLYLGSYRMKKTIIILYRQIPVVKSIRSHNSYRTIESFGSLSMFHHWYFDCDNQCSYVSYKVFVLGHETVKYDFKAQWVKCGCPIVLILNSKSYKFVSTEWREFKAKNW